MLDLVQHDHGADVGAHPLEDASDSLSSAPRVEELFGVLLLVGDLGQISEVLALAGERASNVSGNVHRGAKQEAAFGSGNDGGELPTNDEEDLLDRVVDVCRRYAVAT